MRRASAIFFPQTPIFSAGGVRKLCEVLYFAVVLQLVGFLQVANNAPCTPGLSVIAAAGRRRFHPGLSATGYPTRPEFLPSKKRRLKTAAVFGVMPVLRNHTFVFILKDLFACGIKESTFNRSSFAENERYITDTADGHAVGAAGKGECFSVPVIH